MGDKLIKDNPTIMKDRPIIVIVVPFYNEEKVIADVYQDIVTHHPDKHILFINDGSKDKTADVLNKKGANIITHKLNCGQGAALQTGFDAALKFFNADVVVSIDSDGQHDVKIIDQLIQPILEQKAEVVLGSRFLNSGSTKSMPVSRKLTLKLAVWFTKIMSRIKVTDTHNGLRAFSRSALAKIHLDHDRMSHASEILDKISSNHLSYIEVPVNITYTSYSIQKGQKGLSTIRVLWDYFINSILRN